MNEEGYLHLLQDILAHGEARQDRTGVGTRSIFGRQLRFDLREGRIPVLTTKRVFWRGVVEELLWFLRGDTDANILRAKNVHIWDGNTSRSALDRLGFVDRSEGEGGPIYGHQWRRFGAPHGSTEGGVDQMEGLVHSLRHDPWGRRHILCAWNPKDLPLMALPPCHVLYQFYVHPDQTLSCHLLMRSSDVFLGLPFNIASASLLTYILSAKAGLKGPRELVVSTGDTHLYETHLEVAREQCDRVPRSAPSLVWDPATVAALDWTALQADMFQLQDYSPYPTLAAPMAV